MTTLAEQLQGVSTNFKKNAPLPVQETIGASVDDHIATFKKLGIVQPGTKLPPFALSNATGETISSTHLLAKGPILVTFYRGHWCPYCNLALRALQQQLSAFHAKGVELVAISPELPDTSLSTQEKNDLGFQVLSDVGNKYGRELGLVWKMPDAVRPIFQHFGHDLLKSNGDDSFEIPVPATILVGKDGIIKRAYVEPDYRKRLEPATALEWVEQL